MPDSEPEKLSVLVTGANQGVGFGICRRLINDFLFTHRHPKKLRIIITTRDQRKGDETVRRLKKHLARRIGWTNHWYPASRPFLEGRITFQQEIVELTSLRSVQALGKKLVEDGQKIDVLICNAGIGGWIGMNWPLVVKTVLTDWVHSLTWPTFKISGVGWTTKPQIPSKEGDTSDEPPLGEVFCANIFGHYLLGHCLMPLLVKNSGDSSSCSRIIWISSVEAYSWSLSLNDFQALGSKAPYESSKRLTDVLALTSRLPSTGYWTKQYCDAEHLLDHKANGTSHSSQTSVPKIYVCHPGICSTTVYPMFFVLAWLWLVAIYISRWLGSIWHPATTYKAACAPVWLALEDQSRIDRLEEAAGPGKWGSACDRIGRERYVRTDVEGWGYGGKVEAIFNAKAQKPKGRMRNMPDLTAESREQFEDLGKDCWKRMESLRLEWEARLAKAEISM